MRSIRYKTWQNSVTNKERIRFLAIVDEAQTTISRDPRAKIAKSCNFLNKEKY